MRIGFIFFAVSACSHFLCLGQPDSPLPISVAVKFLREDSLIMGRNEAGASLRECNCLSISDSIKKIVFDVDLSIKNTAEKTIYIWLMNCSWTDNFTINSDYVVKEGIECDINFPDHVPFKPGESRTYTMRLLKSFKLVCPCHNAVKGLEIPEAKIGLILVDDIYSEKSSFMKYFARMRDPSAWKIIWSNPLLLPGEDRRPGQIAFLSLSQQ